MYFGDIPGQSAVSHQLKQMARNQQVPHALLLLGPEGSGNLPLALAFSQYFFCEHPSEEPCGNCPACNKAAKYVHPDIHFSFPVIGANATSNQFLPQWRTALKETPWMDQQTWLATMDAENKQGNINKEECLQIIQKLSLKPFEASKKLLILWLPEFLGREGNRLLKLIEEPPDDTYFILVANHSERILNTLLSRCQLVKINQVPDTELSQWLIEKQAIVPEKAVHLAKLASGNVHSALTMIHSETNQFTAQWVDWLRKAYQGNSVELVTWVERFSAGSREQQKHFLRYGLQYLRELQQMLLLGEQAPLRLQKEELETAKRLVAIFKPSMIFGLTEILTQCFFAVERNANPKMLFMDASLQMNAILRGAPTS